MPRRQPDLIQIAMSDARFRLLSFRQAGFWVHLVSLLMQSSTPGRMQFLGSVLGSVSRLVSPAEPMTETEVETNLATFESLGLVEWDRAEHVLWLVGARDTSRKAEAARINGLRGGRSRKGETLEQARERRQGSLVLPLPGGRTETQETEAEPKRESSRGVTTTSPIKGVSSTPRETPVWVSLGQQVAELAGMNGARGGYDYRPVQGWLSKPGVTPEMVLATVRTVVARSSYPAGRVHTLTYFDGAMDRASTAGVGRPDAAAGWTPAAAQDDAIRQARAAWALNPVGPMPGRAAA